MEQKSGHFEPEKFEDHYEALAQRVHQINDVAGPRLLHCCDRQTFCEESREESDPRSPGCLPRAEPDIRPYRPKMFERAAQVCGHVIKAQSAPYRVGRPPPAAYVDPRRRSPFIPHHWREGCLAGGPLLFPGMPWMFDGSCCRTVGFSWFVVELEPTVPASRQDHSCFLVGPVFRRPNSARLAPK